MDVLVAALDGDPDDFDRHEEAQRQSRWACVSSAARRSFRCR